MNTVRLTDAELEMVRHAMQNYLRIFGHDQFDTVARIKAVIAKLDAATHNDEAEFAS